MYRLTTLTILTLAITGCDTKPALQDESGLFPISVEGKWGYINRNGKIVIEPKFVDANHFSEGLAVVEVAGTSEEDRTFERTYQGFIGPDGEFVIPPEPPKEVREIEGYDSYAYDDFSEGLARIHIDDASGMDGFIDRTGKLVIPPKFDTSAKFSEGLAFAQTWRRWDDPGPKKAGYIDKRGRFVIRNDNFRFGYGFSAGRAVVSVHSDNDDWADGLINRRGEFVIPPGVYSFLSPPVHGAIRVVKDQQVGLVGLDGQVIAPLGKYEQLFEPLDGDIFTAVSDGKVVLIDSTGKRTAEVAHFGDVGSFQNGMATIEQDGRYGYIDAAGAVSVKPRFDAAEPFRHGLAFVKLGRWQGYIDPDGAFVWRTDRWDAPLRNSVRTPLSNFLPATTVEALPLSRNWKRVKNAIVFVADGDLDGIVAWYKKKLELQDDTDFDLEPGKIDLTIYRPDDSFMEVFAVDGATDEADVFVGFYSCENMDSLWKKHPTKVIGIVIEN